MNRLYYGDCLTIMRDKMEPESVDLLYLDPPFNSNRAYNAIYKDETGRPLPDQIEAFCDLWELDSERERAVRNMPVLMREAGIDDDTGEFWRLWLGALRKTQPRLLAYLSYMAERLLCMKGILKPTGSIYLHCDPTASHYIKAMMDGIFGHDNFRNEIVWSYKRWPAKSSRFQRMHDIILYYGNGENGTFNTLLQEPTESSKKRWRGKKQKVTFDDSGQRNPTLEEKKDSPGVPMDDVWTIPIIAPVSKERLGYATQKPLALLERIIKASSNEGDVVFDPFCGCATTLDAAHRLGRKWIGIDIAIHAIKRVAQVRLEDRLGLKEGKDFEIDGVPRTLEGAQALWKRDPYQFQKWAVEQVDGFVTTRKTGDDGIDGRLYFDLPDQKYLQSMVLEVKGGSGVSIGVVRDLRGVLERDDALMAGLIIMAPLGVRKEANFRQEMASAGDLDVLGVKYPRMQMLSIVEILEGQRFHTPSQALDRTPRGRGEQAPRLPLG